MAVIKRTSSERTLCGKVYSEEELQRRVLHAPTLAEVTANLGVRHANFSDNSVMQ